MPDDEKKEAEARQPYTSSDVKEATEFLDDPPPRPGDQTRVVSPYRQGTHGESATFPGGSVKDFRPHVLPSDVEVAETAEPESAPKDSSAPESAESSTETDSPEETDQNASPSPARVAASTVVKASGKRKASESSSQTSSTTQETKPGSDSQPAETPPQTSD